MNAKQKKVLLICLGLLALSILFVPVEMRFWGDSNVATPQALFKGYRLIFLVHGEIALKHILVEWVGLAGLFGGLYSYYKD